MNQLPSERIQEIRSQLLKENGSYIQQIPANLYMDEAILVYLDEEYEKLKKSREEAHREYSILNDKKDEKK